VLFRSVERRGGWFYYNDRKWQGSQQLVDSIREEVDLKESLTIAVMDTLKSHPVLAIEPEDDSSED
jgi:hypothetical protein